MTKFWAIPVFAVLFICAWVWVILLTPQKHAMPAGPVVTSMPVKYEEVSTCPDLAPFVAIAAVPNVLYVKDIVMETCFMMVCVDKQVVSLTELSCSMLNVRLAWLKDKE